MTSISGGFFVVVFLLFFSLLLSSFVLALCLLIFVPCSCVSWSPVCFDCWSSADPFLLPLDHTLCFLPLPSIVLAFHLAFPSVLDCFPGLCWCFCFLFHSLAGSVFVHWCVFILFYFAYPGILVLFVGVLFRLGQPPPPPPTRGKVESLNERSE